jgi:hypothetical protein
MICLLFDCAKKEWELDLSHFPAHMQDQMKQKPKITAAQLLKAVYGKAYRSRHSTSPWVAIGISRATWYRQGKPTRKAYRLTQPQAAARLKVSVRSLQRANRVKRLAPELVWPLANGKLTARAAEARALARKRR